MMQKGLVDFHDNDTKISEAYVRGKLCKLPYPKSSFHKSPPLQQVVSDVCKAPMFSHNGFKFFVTFLDVHTHFAIVDMLRHENEVFDHFVEYEALVRADFGFGISSFLCDNGREFIDRDVVDFCKENGIRLLNSMSYNHQKNSCAERLNKTLEDRSQTMLMDTEIPKTFWSEAILCSMFCINRALTKANDKILSVEWYGNEFHFQKLRPFGCVCYTHIPNQKCKKFDSCAERGIMVGYATIAYKIYNLNTKKIVIPRNVLFDETKFYKDLDSGVVVRNAEGDETSNEELDESVYAQCGEGNGSSTTKDETPGL